MREQREQRRTTIAQMLFGKTRSRLEPKVPNSACAFSSSTLESPEIEVAACCTSNRSVEACRMPSISFSESAYSLSTALTASSAGGGGDALHADFVVAVLQALQHLAEHRGVARERVGGGHGAVAAGEDFRHAARHAVGEHDLAVGQVDLRGRRAGVGHRAHHLVEAGGDLRDAGVEAVRRCR